MSSNIYLENKIENLIKQRKPKSYFFLDLDFFSLDAGGIRLWCGYGLVLKLYLFACATLWCVQRKRGTYRCTYGGGTKVFSCPGVYLSRYNVPPRDVKSYQSQRFVILHGKNNIPNKQTNKLLSILHKKYDSMAKSPLAGISGLTRLHKQVRYSLDHFFFKTH